MGGSSFLVVSSATYPARRSQHAHDPFKFTPPVFLIIIELGLLTVSPHFPQKCPSLSQSRLFPVLFLMTALQQSLFASARIVVSF